MYFAESVTKKKRTEKAFHVALRFNLKTTWNFVTENIFLEIADIPTFV